MKKIITLLLIVLACMLPPPPGDAANYFAHKAGNINADDVWFDDPAAGSGVNAATALAGTHTLYANGYTITIPNTANATFTAAKISNKNDNGATDGGQFQYVTSASYAVTLSANVETGGTTGACLAISGTGAGAARITVIGNISAGSAANMCGILDTHGTGGVVIQGNLTGGSNNSAYGYSWNGATGTVAITGNATGVGSSGVYFAGSGAGAMTLTGDCIGSDTATYPGCWGANVGLITVTGNIIAGTRDVGARGNVAWTPGASNYIKMLGGGTAYYAGPPPDVASVLTTANIINSSDGTVDAGTFDEATRNTDPGVANVKSGTTYNIAGSELTGTMSAGSGGSYGF